MNYEEKYNEILEWARKNKARLNGVPIEEVLPELAESEDEKIRKALIEVFKKKLERGFEWVEYGIPNRSVLDWLEKQKEQKQEKFPPYVTGFKGHPDPAGTSDLEEAAKEYASKTLCDPDDGPSTGLAKESFIAGAEWQKEQKPAEWSEVELEFRGEKVTVKRQFYRDNKGRGYSTAELDEDVAWNALRAWCEKKGISLYDLYPKAEWSEEDEEILKLLILNIGRYMYFGGMSSERILSFLKSLRPQQRQGRSEDKNKLDNICDYIAGKVNFADSAKKDAIKFLKSLTEQLKLM